MQFIFQINCFLIARRSYPASCLADGIRCLLFIQTNTFLLGNLYTYGTDIQYGIGNSDLLALYRSLR